MGLWWWIYIVAHGYVKTSWWAKAILVCMGDHSFFKGKRKPGLAKFSGPWGCFPQTFVVVWTLSVREGMCLCLDLGEIKRSHNGQARQGSRGKWIMHNVKIWILQDFKILWWRKFSPPQCQSRFPFSGGHQTFVSDLLTCQKQHNLRTKCGIIYAEKETSDMKRDKKKRLTAEQEENF